jgi:chemotaxis protein MotB
MAVIPVRKVIKRGGGGHSGGSWKVAYADFVTAMMALFMVLWILSQGPDVRQAIASYFSDPRGIPTNFRRLFRKTAAEAPGPPM